MKELILGLLLITLLSVSSYDILCFYHIPSMSHHHLAKGIVLPLLRAGHNVTWVTPYPDETPVHNNLTIIDVSSVKKFTSSMDSKLSSFSEIKTLTRNISLTTFHHPELRTALVKKQYDAVISEWFLSDVEAGYAAVQQAPWILFSSIIYHPHLEFLVDTTRSIPVYPMMMLDGSTPMSFFQRTKNILLYLFLKLDAWRESFSTESLYKTLFTPLAKARGVTLPPFSEARHDISVLLINSHPSYSPPHVLPPNAVEIGGFHIEDCQEKDLQKLLDGFPHGFIYFSMGSLLKSSSLPLQTRKDLIKILGQVPFPVLWKYEENIDNLPSNLYVRKWFPQAGVLGEILTTQGYKRNILSCQIKYHIRAKYLSKLFRNRPVAPEILAVHYIELAIETKGAYHLRSKAQLYEWYQLLMLDQLVFFIIVLYLLYNITKIIFRLIRKLIKKEKQKES